MSASCRLLICRVLVCVPLVVGGGRRADGHRSLHLEAHAVDLELERDIPVEHATGLERPCSKDQLVDVTRREQVDATRRVQVDLAVLLRGGHAGRTVEHQATSGVGRARRRCTGVQAPDQVDRLAGRDVGANDELAVRAHLDAGVHGITHDVAAQVLALAVTHHLTPTPGQQQALHVHITDPVETDFAC